MKNKYGNALTKKLVKKIILSTTIYTCFFLLIYIIARTYCESYVWQPYDKTYQFLKMIKDNVIIEVIVWLIGVAIISFYHLRKTLAYIDAIVLGSSKLLIPNEYIRLPEELKDIEISLNKIKEKAFLEEKKKNDLIVYLAHDIKTPLTSLIGYLHLLKEEDNLPLENRKKYLDIALSKSERLEELINELFDITKFSLDEIHLQKEEINLNLMVEQIIDDFYPLTLSLHKEIEFIKKDKIVLKADSNLLARVISNLIKNALNYSYQDTSILITTYIDQKYAYLTVSNKGDKIKEEDLNKIFAKFYRVDKARKTSLGGSGLGLAISKEIILKHHGDIEVSSDEEETKFTIKLPL